MTTYYYPKLFDRVKAAIVDSLILLGLMIIVVNIFSLFENISDVLRIIAFIFFFILYDPIMTSTFGGTIGHMILGIRVKREKDQERNIHFLSALLRFIVKALLGWISLITVTSNEKNKAIHDNLVGSIVNYK